MAVRFKNNDKDISFPKCIRREKTPACSFHNLCEYCNKDKVYFYIHSATPSNNISVTSSIPFKFNRFHSIEISIDSREAGYRPVLRPLMCAKICSTPSASMCFAYQYFPSSVHEKS